MAKVVGYDESLMKRCTCKKCAAIIEYAPKEVRQTYTKTSYDGSKELINVISCPNCMKDIIV